MILREICKASVKEKDLYNGNGNGGLHWWLRMWMQMRSQMLREIDLRLLWGIMMRRRC